MKFVMTLEALDKASKPIKALQKTAAGFNGATVKGAKQATAGYSKTAKAIEKTTKATAQAEKATVSATRAAETYHTSTMKGAARASLGHAQTARAVATVTRATEQATRASANQSRAVQGTARAQADAAIAAARVAAAQDKVALAAARTARKAERAARMQARQARRDRALERLGERRGREFGGGLRGAADGAVRTGHGLAAGGRAAAGVAAGGGIVGLGAGFVTSQLVAPAGQFERYQTILETVTKSSEKARQSMEWVSAFAAKTPFDLDGVTEAFVKLKTYGFDPTNGTLKTLGDASAAMGKPLLQTVEALADAATGENERLKEYGIVARKVGKEFQYVYTDAATGQQRMYRALAGDRAGMMAAILKIFSSNYDGAMERQSGTWEGMVSNLGDTWSRISGMIMGAGLFDWMKGKLSELLTTVDSMAADGSLKVWATEVSNGLQRAMEIAWNFGKGLVKAIQIIMPWMERAAAFLGGWENLALALIALPFLPALLGIAAGFAQLAAGVAVASLAFIRIAGIMRTAGAFAPLVRGLGMVFRVLTAPIGLAVRGFMMLGAAMMATPIGWVVAGVIAIAGAAYLIYDNWGSIGPWFQRQWESVTGWFSDAWAVISGFDWASLVPDIDWSQFLPTLEWDDALPKLNWANIVSVLDWLSWVHPIRWLELIPGFSWSDIIPVINWSSWFAFSWSDVLPNWSWSDIIPSMPDFSSWFGGGTQAAEKLGSALPNGPAALERMAAASGRIAENTAAIAGIDTAAALNGVNGVSEAARAAIVLVQGIPPAVQSAMGQTRAVLSAMSFHAEGMALMSTLAAGIRAGAAQAVAAVRGVAQQLRDHLPHSPAKTGPLSDLHRIRFSETLASGIRPGPAVAAVRAVAAVMMGAVPFAVASPAMAVPVAAPLSPPVSGSVPLAAKAPAGGGGVSVVINAPLTLTLNGNASESRDEFEQRLREHADMIGRIIDDRMHARQRLEY